jgi:phosphate starvation-inducible PhoH-like protein
MRGRTLDHAFVILDEAQNATLPQLKMFLTRMGRNAKFVITGDATQVDLPDRHAIGLCPTGEQLAQRGRRQRDRTGREGCDPPRTGDQAC